MKEPSMTNKPLPVRDVNHAAAELIDRNVSFDFRAFLGKVDPTPSRVVSKRPSEQRSKPEQAQSNRG
jgi:hypothetical protein